MSQANEVTSLPSSVSDTSHSAVDDEVPPSSLSLEATVPQLLRLCRDSGSYNTDFGRRTGIRVEHVPRDSDGFESFEDLINRFDARMESRLAFWGFSLTPFMFG